MRPATVRMKRGADKVVHDVGEMVRIPTASASVSVTIVVEDANGLPLAAIVHVGHMAVPANQTFVHTFHSDYDAKRKRWSREIIWVECPGFSNEEIGYEVEVE